MINSSKHSSRSHAKNVLIMHWRFCTKYKIILGSVVGQHLVDISVCVCSFYFGYFPKISLSRFPSKVRVTSSASDVPINVFTAENDIEIQNAWPVGNPPKK